MRCDNTYYLLLPAAKAQHTHEPYCSKPIISFDLTVDDIEKAKNYLQKRGVEFESEWEPGSPRFFIRDPDGLVIEIIEKED